MNRICVVGTGRMGKGLALAFAYAGLPVALIDSEVRDRKAFESLERATRDELDSELRFLQTAEVLNARQSGAILDRIRILDWQGANADLAAADGIFEAVVEVRDIKRRVYDWIVDYASTTAIISSTTSTLSANDLAGLVTHPERFVNAHWLNPAHLMPLVEVSPADRTSKENVDKLVSLLERVGKQPVVCKASPGFIVPRIQALAMNEAARLVEEGIASAEDIDRAVRVGFGIRFATLGLLEFIDWGGGDILYHATRYLGDNVDPNRFNVPDIVQDNMANERNGLRDGEGFYDWRTREVEEYRREKLTDFVRLLQFQNLMPPPSD
ncbi:3-hydroxybutyryl-CoA dehydrogenase [Elongatibacter sediminis]|uniref:L-gulonate 3-dehydrogenase n=1 Tax=Elongatibacter sediminis TaxID=3119006 RepID=A0AAW9RCA0_9GAMM